MLAHLTQVLIAWGPLGILLLSIIDSAGVPVAGAFDFLLVVIAVERPSVAWWCAGFAVIGSSVGNVLLFYASRRGGERFMSRYASEGRSTRFRAWFRRYGLLTVFIPALIPIPLPMKLFVITAGIFATPIFEFLSVVLSGRILRYCGEVWLGVTLGHESGAFLKSHVWHFAASAVVLFAILYALVALKHRASGDAPGDSPGNL